MQAPDVTVIIGAYNAMPYVTACMQSVVDQSIGRHRLEVIAVDDGSTDATGKELDSFADQYPALVRVVHQENSGSPSGPRNVGLDLARGRYVFFLDADDYLGLEALERMVAMADAEGSDVVLGKMAGVNGRGVPASMFTANQPRADLYSSRVWWTLSATKLFRRDHVQALGLRFPTHYTIGEDQLFTSRAYFDAQVISVVADYECYFATRRDDGGNITATDTDLARRLRFLADMCALVGERVEAGPRRNHLLRRQFGIDLDGWTGRALLHKEPEEQRRLLEQAADIIRDWGSDGVLEPLRALLRLRLHLIGRGLFDQALEVLRFEVAGGPHDVVQEDGTVFAAYPYFRDPAVGAPDSCYDITRQLSTVHHLDAFDVDRGVVRLAGHVRVQRVDTAGQQVEVLLRERESQTEYRLAATPPATSRVEQADGDRGTEPGGFVAEIDTATAADGSPLPRGLWDVHLVVRSGGLQREVRLGARRSDAVDASTRLHLASSEAARPAVLTTYFTKPHGNLTLDVGEVKHRVSRFLRDSAARCSEDGEVLSLSGRLPGVEMPAEAVSLQVRGSAGEVRAIPATVDGDVFRADLPLPEVPLGLWSLCWSFELGGGRAEIPVPGPASLPALRWRRGLRWFYAVSTGSKKQLELRLDRLDVVAGGRRGLAKVVRRARAA